MKILLIGLFDEGNTNSNCGYNNAVSGMHTVLERMVKEKIVEKVDTLDANTFGDVSELELEYDISFSFVHPSSFLNPAISQKFKDIHKKCKKNYLSVVFETKPLPAVWNTLFKSSVFDGYVSPSKFILDQIPSKNKFLLPHYINPDDFEKINIDEKVKKEDKFKCLYVGQYTSRKGIIETLTSFARILGGNSDCKLILKYHEMSQVELPMDMLIKNKMYGNCKTPIAEVYTIQDKLDFDDLKKLYRKSSLFINLSRGEGFGLCSAESMCSGLPMIYTNWSALREVSSGMGNIPIDYNLDVAHDMTHHGYEHGLQYAYPKIKDAERALLMKYESWKKDKRKYYEEVSNNWKLIEDRFGYKAIKNYFVEILKK